MKILFSIISAIMPVIVWAQQPSETWIADVQHRIEAEEYYFSWDEGRKAYQCPNRNNNFRTLVRQNGIEIISRFDNVKTENWTFKLIPLGESNSSIIDNRLSTQKQTRFESGKAIIQYLQFETSYINNMDGLEFIYTLIEPTSERGIKHFETEVQSDLQYKINAAGDFTFYLESGEAVLPKLRISKLMVIDADGKELTATMTIIESRSKILLSIEYDDTDATYPIVIDPLISTPTWVYTEELAGKLGFSAQIVPDINGDGFDDIIGGAPNYDGGHSDEGRALLFLGDAFGASLAPIWSVESNQAFANMGRCVSYAGDVNGDGFGDVVVGAPRYDSGSTDEGRAYLYYGNVSGLNTTASWTYEPNQTSTYLGNFISDAGDVNNDGFDDLAIGMGLYNGVSTDCGRVVVFYGSISGLPPAYSWAYNGTHYLQYLGNAIDGNFDANNDGYDDLIVAGYNTDNPENNEGRLFLFYGSAIGLSLTPVWTDDSNVSNRALGKYVVALGDVNGDGFGDFAASSENMINPETGTATGAVLIYYGTSTIPADMPLDTLYGDYADDKFGYVLGGGGDFNNDGFRDMLVASSNYNGDAEGKVYLYRGGPLGIDHETTWTFADYYNEELFYYYEHNLSLGGDVNNDGFDDILLGITSNFYGKGSLKLFFGGEIIPAEYPGQVVTGNQTSAKFGFAVTGNGDANNDGFADVIIAAPYFDSGSTDEGKVFYFKGSADSLSDSATWTAEGNQVSALFGSKIEFLSDFNNDGFDDLIVSAPNYDLYFVDEGRVYIYKGTTFGFGYLPLKTFLGGQAGAKLGSAISQAPTLNGDVYADIVMSAPYYNNGLAGQGRVLAYTSTGTTFTNTPYFTLTGSQTNENFGFALDATEDINFDGYSDVAVSSPLFDGAFTDEGRVNLFLGGPAFSATPVWTYDGGQATSQFGFSLAMVGQTSDQSYTDLVIGQPYFDNGQTDEGSIYYFRGNATGLNPTASFMNEGDSTTALMGYGIFALGDISNDHYADFAVSILNGDYGFQNQGLLHVYFGTGIGVNKDINIVSVGADAANQFGFSASAAGDLNGDDIHDFIIGAPLTDGTFTDQGSFFQQFGKQSNCDSIFPGLTFTPDTFSIDVSFADFDETRMINFRYRKISEFIWSYDSTTSSSGKIIEGLSPCTGYIIELQKSCLGGSTPWQTSGTIITLGCAIDCAPYIISDISATGITTTSATLSWTSPTPVYNYEINFRKSGLVDWDTVYTFDNLFTLTTLDSCSIYEYRIRTNCGASLGPWSTVENFTSSGVCVLPCSVPTGLFYNNLTPTSVKTNWTAVPSATKYKVGYRLIGGPWQYVNATTTSKTIGGLTPGSNYEFKVRTICGLIMSDYSASVPFATPLKLSDTNHPGFTVFPNPTAGNFTIIVDDVQASAAELCIYDLTGKKIYAGSILCGTEQFIGFDPPSSGAYLVRVANTQIAYNFMLQVF